MTFLVESVIACLAFTLMVFLMSRDSIKVVFNYPPVIIERCRSLGLVDDSNRPGGPVFYAKKLIALLLFGVLLGLLVRYVNGCTTFWCGVFTAYALWFCHDKHFVIPGTEDMVSAYHDYWFHIKGGFIGMVLAIPSVLIAGVIVIL